MDMSYFYIIAPYVFYYHTGDYYELKKQYMDLHGYVDVKKTTSTY